LRSTLNLRRMRSVQMTIAATMLAVPASAVALTSGSGDSSPHPSATTRPLPVRVSPKHVSLGDPIEVAGTAPASDPGAKVTLEALYGRRRAWQRLSTASVSRAHRFTFHAHPSHSGLLRAVPASGSASLAEPRAYADRTSQTMGGRAHRVTPVQVSADLITHGRQRDVLAGGSVIVAGKLLPGRQGRTVALQGHSQAGWRTLARARTGHRGGFAVRYRPQDTALGRNLRVVFPGDPVNARSTGPAGAMSVYRASVASWYEDGGSTACGFHAGLGVANRSLPCGTKVRFRHAGHTVTATVDDRGPYVGGRDFDLNQTTAAALGFDGVGTVWSTG
jgi:rare lipoprotein A